MDGFCSEMHTVFQLHGKYLKIQLSIATVVWNNVHALIGYRT